MFEPSANYWLFSNRKGFNYWSYLEQKSHFDGLGLSVDRSIKEQTASNEALAREGFRVIQDVGKGIEGEVRQSGEAIQETISDGTARLELKLDEVTSSVSQLASVCEIGFSRIDLQLSNIDQSIGELIQTAQNPDKNWAFEKFDDSRTSYRRHLFVESLEYIEKAINGDQNNSGYKIDYRFHILKGHIHLGGEHNTSREIVDLEKALNCFQTAARYAEHDSKSGFAKSLQLAGWASYCLGNFAACEDYMRRSLVVVESDSHTRFLLAKVLFHESAVAEAADLFAQCIRHDYKYTLRAGSDPDFLRNRNPVEAAIKNYRYELINSIKAGLTDYRSDEHRDGWAVMIHYGLAQSYDEINELDETVAQLDQMPISDLLKEQPDVSKKLNDLRVSLSSAYSELMNRAKGIRSTPHDGIEAGSSSLGIGFVVGILVLIGSFIFFLSEANGTFDVVMTIIFGIPLAIVFGLIASWAATALSFVSIGTSNIFSESSFRSAKAQEADVVISDAARLSRWSS